MASRRTGEDVRCVSLGGNVFINLKGELRFPVLPETIEGAIFVDAGNLWVDPERFVFWKLRPTTGIGIRWLSPVGPVAFDVGFNLIRDEERREDMWDWHFNIGVF